jgi:hypothetical protein
MKYAGEVGSDAKIYVQIFVKFGSAILKDNRRDSQT